MSRRPIVHDAETHIQFEETCREGIAAGPAIGARADALEADIECIERLIERGDTDGALQMAAVALGMAPADLFALLPGKTAVGLYGYLNGLLEGSRGMGLLPVVAAAPHEAMETDRRLRWASGAPDAPARPAPISRAN